MDIVKIEELKQKTTSAGAVGIFMKSNDPAFVEAAGYAGLDFVILDMEHGPVGYESMQSNVRAAEVSGLLPIVRVESLSGTAIAKSLDMGASGVQVPQIANAEQARRAVRFAKFHPMGERGVCRFVRAANYSAMPGAEYFSTANQALVILQLEGLEAIENLEEILTVEGVDILFIGPYDLSQSLGLTGQTTHPKVVEQMRVIVDKARKRGKATGTFTDSEKTLRMWKEAGVGYLSYSVDVGIFREACSALKQVFEAVQ